MYAFTNHFSRSALYQRVGMMNRRRSGWERYVLWAGLMGVMVLACRHRNSDDEFVLNRSHPKLPPTNATRMLVNELEAHGMPWYRQAALLHNHDEREQTKIVNGKRVIITSVTGYPEILCLRNNRLALLNALDRQVKLFINGQESLPEALSALTFDEIDELLVYKKEHGATGAEKFPESYRVFVSTTHGKPAIDFQRTQWKQYLQAAGISDHPMGHASTYTMNKLLEATFFNDKLTFVKRTKDNHLTLLPAYSENIDLYINGLPVTADAIAKVHVREVDKLYANERSFEEWADGPNRKSRFVLYIQTAPNRAKRDSSYYVFSPFYTGDF